jgi:hypothetical protein
MSERTAWVFFKDGTYRLMTEPELQAMLDAVPTPPAPDTRPLDAFDGAWEREEAVDFDDYLDSLVLAEEE